MHLDLPPKPALWTPPRPAIIRAAPDLPRAQLDQLFDRDMLVRQQQERLRRGLMVGSFAASSAGALRKKGGAVALTATFISTYSDMVDRTTYTAPSLDLNYDKIIAVAHGSNINSNPTAFTINGTTASLVVGAFGTSHNSSMWIADITPTASGSIVATWSGTVNRFVVGWWGISGLNNTTAVDTGSSTSATAFSDTLTTIAGGFLIIGATPGYNASGATWGFSGTGLTENYDLTQDDNVRAIGGLAPTAGTTYAVSGSYSGAMFGSTIAASFGN